MTEPIEIPESFPAPGAVAGKRVVLTGAGRGLGAVLAHAFSRAGASVALVARTERDLKASPPRSRARRWCSAATSPTRSSTRRWPTPSSPSGAASTCGSATPGSRPSWPGPRETDPSVWRQVLEVNLTGAFLGARAAARVMGAGRAADLHRFGAGERPRRGSRPTARRRRGSSGWPRAWPSTWLRRASP